MLNDRHGPLQVKIARSVYALHVVMCLLEAPTEEIFYLILSRRLKVFLRSQDLKEQEFNNFTKRNHFLFQ